MARKTNTKKKRVYKKRSFLAKAWRRYEYKHTTLALLTVAIFILALDTALIQGLFLAVQEAGAIGILLTGILFVSFFTAAPATLILVSVAEHFNPYLLALIAGAGSVVGDILILKFFEENIAYELRPLAKKYGVMTIIRQMKTKKFRPFALLIGMGIIASPGPDELGLGLLGIAKIPARKLLPVLYLLNSGGIFLLVSGARAVSTL